MVNVLRTLYDRWRERRRERAIEVLDELKARYHTFRILLTHNELALDLLRSVDQMLLSPLASREALSDETEELLDVTYELIDGLNRLAANGYGSLYDRHDHLAASIRKALASMLAHPSHAPRCIALSHVNGEYRGLVGGKAATLGILKRAGFPVPDGFAVTVDACKELLTENGLDTTIRRRLQRFENATAGSEAFEAEAEEVRDRILEASLPAGLEADLRASFERSNNAGGHAFSVRSSALVEDRPEHSFAGQFKSVLNVTTFDALVTALKEVIASNYSARAIAYRLHAGLSPASHDMAVLCQVLVPAHAAGGLFTVDPTAPENGRMLMNAVPGLGILAVNGSAPTDLYRPMRDFPDWKPMLEWAQIAEKTHRAVALKDGGLREQSIPDAERKAPVLTQEQAVHLVRYGRMIESLIGKPQDIEWALNDAGEIFILQSRDIRLATKAREALSAARGKPVLKGGVTASPGRCVGRVTIVHSKQDIDSWRKERRTPSILVLHQSLVDAAGWLPEFEGVVVDLGNPADHLSCVAREICRPMLTGAGRATEMLQDGEWVILDADSAVICQAPEEVWSEAAALHRSRETAESHRQAQAQVITPEAARIRELIEPLNLTDAYGPTFSIHECRSLHDIIRYTHEMAVLAMFRVGDAVLEESDVLTHRLEDGLPFHFLVIDLGGGIVPGKDRFKIHLEDVLSAPLLALCKGIATPGLRWGQPPPGAALSGLLSRAMLDARSAREVGSPNYALITRDYLNLNARVDYHFTMVDAVCSANPRENYIRFRFKGGGTTAVQRERRARFVSEVLGEHHFFTDQQGDLVNATLSETGREETAERLVMIGRLLGFSRLLDATMSDDAAPRKVAQAFLAGDYALKSFGHNPA